ncbi:15253_t:CDS:10 [Acaulospora colombiana]|uniref:15253_t:CDS:1 n=1 Tax=Acaulospora colombiana TaxID=27376 RepID=A0ACA9MMW4_9GLOM|nr:15253_t:CDS:10 [Acaulospora colombiana]
MSRVPPFSTNPNRTRNVIPPSSYSQDSRPSSMVSDGAGIPARPSRSELRGVQPPGRPGAPSSARNLNRDSVSTTFSDREGPVRRPMRAPERDRGPLSEPETPSRNRSPTSPEDSTSPRALQNAISALQSAGNRRQAKRKATLDQVSPGGFGSYEDMEREELERRRREQARADAERKERMRERELAARRQNGNVRRRGKGDIDAVLDEIQGEWEWVTRPEFNPVELALALLDDSSVGKDMNSFARTKRMLEGALKGSIEASLPHHASVMSSLNTTADQIKDSKTKLVEAKEALGSKRADLAQLWTRGQTLDEMIKIVDEIDYLKSVPDTLETLISEKRLLQASSLLLRSTKIIAKSDMQDIGALSDLKAYLSGQETAYGELIPQASKCVSNQEYRDKFLKCPLDYVVPKVEFDEEKLLGGTMPITSKGSSPRLVSFLHNLNLKANDPPYDPSSNSRLSLNSLMAPYAGDSTQSQTNPEADSFSYIETVLESLAILGQLGSSLEMITQRLPMELYSLVEATIDEVNERTEFSKRLPFTKNANVVAAKAIAAYVYIDPSSSGIDGSNKPSGLIGEAQSPVSLLRLAALENSASVVDHAVLRDLFWTLFSKLDAVCQSLRRKDFKDISGAKPGTIFSFPELWEPIDAELKGLILLYLTEEKGGASTGKTQVPSINDALKAGGMKKEKGWLSNRLNKPHEEELTRVLKDSVPGLVGGTETSVQTALATAVDDRFASAVPHRLLVPADSFHVSVLFHPTLALLDRAAEVLPSTTAERVRQSSSFLDDFVLKVCLPQLGERVADIFLKTVTSPDAFLPDPGWKKLSNRPLVKSTIELVSLINSLCAMQQTTPFHRDNYSRLMLGLLIDFYQRCSDRFKELVSTREGMTQDEAHVAVAARWAQRPEEDDIASSRGLCRQETRVELNFLTTATVDKDDLVFSKNLHSLGNLFHSMTWFMRQLVSMKSVVDDPLSPGPDQAIESEAGFTAVTPHFPLLPPAPKAEELRLLLSKPMALRFDALMQTYEQLAEYVLATLRIDTRCRTIHFLDLAMRRGNYRVERDGGDPDPHIVDLNLDLGHLLISNARHIRFANAVGIQKILRNMLAMQQNMKTITDASQDADFERAKVYYSLFSLTPREMLASIKKKPQFTLEEYKSMLNFQCGVDQALGENGASNATDRNYHAYLTELHALAIEDSTE